MNRNDLQGLAETRLREAQALLNAGEPAGAYYLCGYAVECALKACFARGVRQYDFPDKGLALKVHTHDLVSLRRLAGLERAQLSPAQEANWLVAKDWAESSRYEPRTMKEANALVGAVGDPNDGVLAWLRQHW